MGSRLKEVLDHAYIAGFLDGDGSLMLQLKKRKDTSRGFRFMATLCLYQDSRHEKDLLWIKRILGCGYIARRSDGITELRINGFVQVREVLEKLRPYIRFKKKQARALVSACEILEKGSFRTTSTEDLKRIVAYILEIQNENYQSVGKHLKTQKTLYASLGLTP